MPNPGRMAGGVVLTGPQGQCAQLAQVWEGTGCNNQAELQALCLGLERALSGGAQQLRIYTDSQWLLQQLQPQLASMGAVRLTLRLAAHLEQARHLLLQFAQVQWRWVPRHCNTQADDLARKVLLKAIEIDSSVP